MMFLLLSYFWCNTSPIALQSRTKRCYSYTGNEKDGFFYPLHVAAESGHKNLSILLVRAGADEQALDYRGSTAEEKCNGAAKYAFFELRGLKYESTERYVGKTDRNGAQVVVKVYATATHTPTATEPTATAATATTAATFTTAASAGAAATTATTDFNVGSSVRPFLYIFISLLLID